MNKIAFERRLDVLEMVYAAKSGHIGGSMSCMDILVALYYQVMDIEKILNLCADRDRFILSKGHCAEALYAVLADRGFFHKSELRSFGGFNSAFAEHPTKKIPGVEVATGALGHGLSLGVGMAIGLKSTPAMVYVLMGDGELAEGSVWEAAMSAARYKLDNLVAIIDRNGKQISGDTEDVMPLENLTAKFQAFGWETRTCNGHDPQEIANSLTPSAGKPLALIAKTIKGYGAKQMEGIAEWHHKIPSHEEYNQIKAELMQRRDINA